MWVYGNGDYRFYAENADGTYESPPQDFGTLVYEPGIGYQYTATDQTEYDFDEYGDLTAVVDPDGLGTQYSYNSDGGLASMTAIDGGETTLSYSGGELSQIQEPGNRTWNITIAGQDLTEMESPDGQERTFTYGGNHLLTEDDWAPIQTTIDYTDGLVSSIQSGTSGGATPAGEWAIKTVAGQGYDDPAAFPSDAVATVTDVMNYQSTYQFTSNGVELMYTRPDGRSETWELNEHDQITTFTDFMSYATSYDYDPSPEGDGDLTEIDYPDGSSVQYQYELTFHQVTQYINQDTHVTSYAYDAEGEMISETDAVGTDAEAITRYEWSDGLLVKETDPDGYETNYTYNSNRQTLTVIDENSSGTIDKLEDYSYDMNGNVTYETDGAGGIYTFTTDGVDRLVSAVNPVTDTYSSSYAPDGQATETVDGRGISTSYEFDASGLLTTTIQNSGGGDGGSRTTNTEYDADANLTDTIDVTDPTDDLGNTSSSYYDINGRDVADRNDEMYVSDTIYDDDSI